MISTGVRWAESVARKNNRAAFEKLSQKKENRILVNDNDSTRMLFENCQLKAKRVVNPIIDWEDKDVFTYVESEKIQLNPLYEEGFCRVGCIGCPIAGKAGREKEFLRWPKYKDAYIRSFQNMIHERAKKGLETEWQTGTDVFNWWMEYDVLPGQIDFEEMMKD